MDEWEAGFGEKSRLKALLDHFSEIEDPRPSHKVAYPLSEVLLLAVCGTIADCDSFEAIGLWGDRHLDFLRRFLPYHHRLPTGRWLTLLISQTDPALFSACFTDWVRACWPDRPELGGPILTAKVGVEGSNLFARSSSLPLISGS